jgi:hypothetical protein
MEATFFSRSTGAGAGLASGLLPLTSTADSASLGRSKHGLDLQEVDLDVGPVLDGIE